MKILVSNIGSTSFKFRLIHLETETEAASGNAERIGGTGGRFEFRLPQKAPIKTARDFRDHGEVIQAVMTGLIEAGILQRFEDLDAVAFKAVMGGDLPVVCQVDDQVLEQMEYFAPVAPAHNPPYLSAMRMFGKLLGNVPLVACFDSGFHKTIPERRNGMPYPESGAFDTVSNAMDSMVPLIAIALVAWPNSCLLHAG